LIWALFLDLCADKRREKRISEEDLDETRLKITARRGRERELGERME